MNEAAIDQCKKRVMKVPTRRRGDQLIFHRNSNVNSVSLSFTVFLSIEASPLHQVHNNRKRNLNRIRGFAYSISIDAAVRNPMSIELVELDEKRRTMQLF